MRSRKRIAALVASIGGGILVLGAAFMAWQIGPKNIIGMLRYDQRQDGALRVGDPAPDAELVALDGATRVHLLDRGANRPIVLIFGSFT